MTQVALNLVYLAPGETGGMETYARMLVPRLIAARPEVDFVLYVSRAGGRAFDELRDAASVVVTPCEARNKARRAAYEQSGLRLHLRRDAPDLLHNLANTGPLWRTGPTITTVHDLIPARAPESVPSWIRRVGLLSLTKRLARQSDRVITVSKASAADISELCGVDEGRIDVTPLAARKPGSLTPAPELRARHSLGDSPLVISPSARAGHKNIAGLLRGFAAVNTDPLPKLVLPGISVGADDQLMNLAADLGVADRVRLLGWISDEDLDGLYSTASCLAFASFIEGFGLPVLEALARGLPVAVSGVSAMPEVAGEAALYFDPHNPEEIASCIERLLTDTALAERLSAAGIRRSGEFSWDRTAELTLQSYDRVLLSR